MQPHCSWTMSTKREPAVECNLDVCDPTRATYGVIPVCGTHLGWRSVGYGQTLLLLHGVPGDCETLAPIADLLAETGRASTVSLRYSGDGPHCARPFGTQQQYEDLIEIVETIGGPIDLAAWSYSAHAAQALAIERPSQVRSLYLFEPGFPTFVSEPDDLARIEEDTMSAFGPVFGALSAGDIETARLARRAGSIRSPRPSARSTAAMPGCSLSSCDRLRFCRSTKRTWGGSDAP